MNKILKVSALIALIICITGCSFFSTSWGAGLKRENAEELSALSMDDLAVLLSDPDYLSDPAAIESLLEALGSKTPEEIQNLSPEEKQAILDLTISVGVPISSLGGIIDQAASGDAGSALAQLVASTDVIDTDAAAAVLTDPETLQTADTTVIAAATMTVLVQVAAAETDDSENQDEAVDELVNNITQSIADSPSGSTPEQVVDSMIADGSISAESREEMIAVTTSMQVLTGTSPTGIDRSGDSSGSGLLGGLL